MQSTRCALALPEGPLVAPLPPARPSGLPSWGAANLSALRHGSPYLFIPLNHSSDGWESAIWASQFPPRCKEARFLLFEDDLFREGLGFTALVINALMQFAIRQRRVLVEVPLSDTQSEWPRYHRTERRTAAPRNASGREKGPRWCTRPPFTLQCFYDAWTHCTPPAASEHIPPKLDPIQRIQRVPKEAVAVRLRLSWFKATSLIFFSGRGAASSAEPAIARFLFRPRPWVVDAARCVMSRHGLQPRGFVSMFVRQSAEKHAEMSSHGHRATPLRFFHEMARRALSLAHSRKLFLSTSSPAAVQGLRELAAADGVEMSFTENERMERDAWGGWVQGGETLQGMIAAVNGHVASQALLLLSTQHSSWTNFLHPLLGREAEPRSWRCGAKTKTVRILAHATLKTAAVDAALRRERDAEWTCFRQELAIDHLTKGASATAAKSEFQSRHLTKKPRYIQLVS